MADDFRLPDSPPPGNVFPPAASGTVVTMTKSVAQAVVVEIRAPDTPRPSGDHDGDGDTHSDSTSSAATPERRARKTPRLTVQTGAPPEKAASRTSSVTLQEEGDITEQTPVMRSMFPRYDPEVRMSRQDYAPQTDLLPPPPPLPTVLPKNARPYSASVYSHAHSPPAGPLSSPWIGAMGMPAPARPREGSSSAQSPELSAPEELLDLWTIANGQLCSDVKATYTLELQCESLSPEREVMQFASAAGPVYRLQASGAAVVLTRRHPLDASTEVTVATPALQTPSTTSPLLASIFPSLAELLALDTASNVAIANQLSRADSTALQAEALQRARATEAAALLWDSDSGAYFYTVPSLNHPTAPLPQALAIAIHAGRSVVLLDPARRPLLALDLHQAVLTVHGPTIVALSASLYAVDLTVTVLLTVLLQLHRHTSLLAPLAMPVVIPHFAPPPTIAAAAAAARPGSRASRRSKASVRPPPSLAASKPSRWRSIRRGSARSEPPLRSPGAVSSLGPTSPPLGGPTKDLEAQLCATTLYPSVSRPIPPLPPHGVAPELRRETTGVDLSRFQAFDLSDPELGRGTRTALRVLYWAFGVLVWVLGVAIGVLAAGIVAVGGCVGSSGSDKKSKKKGARPAIEDRREG